MQFSFHVLYLEIIKSLFNLKHKARTEFPNIWGMKNHSNPYIHITTILCDINNYVYSYGEISQYIVMQKVYSAKVHCVMKCFFCSHSLCEYFLSNSCRNSFFKSRKQPILYKNFDLSGDLL